MQFNELIAQLDKKYKIWESFYKNEIVGIDDRTKQPVTFQPPNNADKASFEEWQKGSQDGKGVRNPITNEFYKIKDPSPKYDNDGNKLPNTTTETDPYFYRNQIVRVRAISGAEFLYSRGLMAAGTQLGNEQTSNFQAPELWIETRFKRENRFMSKENQYREIAIGPTGKEVIHYTMPWTPENVDKLMENAAPDVRLVITEEGNKTVYECPTLEMFKFKPFDYIKNADYYSPEEKERIKKESEALTEQIITENKKTIAARK